MQTSRGRVGVDDKTVRSVRASLPVAEIPQLTFKQWKQRRGEFPPSQTAWGQRLQAVPGVSRRRSNGMKYVGIQLTDEEARRAQYAA